MRGTIKMKFSVTFRTDYDIKLLCENLMAACRCDCPVGKLPCPFGSKNCDEVTVDDWKNVIKEVKE